jgi:hypothetical protein
MGQVAEHTTQRPEREQPAQHGNGRYVLYAIAAVVATAATFALVVVLLLPDGDEGSAAPPSEAAPASGFVFFSEVHATVLVSPGTAGENTVDIAMATHDGSDANVSAVTVAVSDPSGTPAAELPAEPVEGAAGTFRLSGVAIPTAGDWQFTLTVTGENAEPETASTAIPIGAPSGS